MGLIQCHMNEFMQEFKADNEGRIKAGQTAVKVEGFRLMRLLQSEIKAAAPGGQAFTPLTEIAKQISGSAIKHKNKPLYTLYDAIRYNAANPEGTALHVEVGAVDTRRARLSASWKRIMTEQQEGVTKEVTESMRHRLRLLGAAQKEKRGKFAKGKAAYFFLKASTTQFKTPARDIINAFWAAYQGAVMPNIQNNFERKMRGERI